MVASERVDVSADLEDVTSVTFVSNQSDQWWPETSLDTV